MSNLSKNPLPRWRGFNLLEKFSADNSSKSVRFASANPPFQESDFRWISDWGFDFVRLPMSYHCWSSPERWMEMDESILAHVDEAVELGRRHGIHVCLNLHRAPGYCVNPPPEPGSLWRDADALEACCHHWRTLAKRYVGVSSAQLSFDLLNEPPAPFDGMTRPEHERVIRALTGAIREVDPARSIIADGLSWGERYRSRVGRPSDLPKLSGLLAYGDQPLPGPLGRRRQVPPTPMAWGRALWSAMGPVGLGEALWQMGSTHGARRGSPLRRGRLLP